MSFTSIFPIQCTVSELRKHKREKKGKYETISPAQELLPQTHSRIYTTHHTYT